MTRWSRLVGAVAAASAAALLVGAADRGPRGRPEIAGVAVVIDRDQARGARLPSLSDLRAHPRRVAQAFAAAGLRVAADPSGRYLAVARPRHIADNALLAGDLPDVLLAAGIMERTTTAQLALREKGYLRADHLSTVQSDALRRAAQRQGMLDAEGRIVRKGAHLSVGMWALWLVHLAAQVDGQTVCVQLGQVPRPPTEPAVPRPPLDGSVLWFSWPYAAAAWGNERISVKPGEYALAELAAMLSRAGETQVSAAPPTGRRRVAVVAENAPVRTLLWAVQAATGLAMKAGAGRGRLAVILSDAAEPAPRAGNLLTPLPGLGYYSPSDCAIGRALLSRLGGGPTEPRRYWMGWRLSDLPLLYRSWVAEEWRDTYRSLHREPAPPLEPDHTFVLWTKAAYISTGMQFEDGSGGGYEFLLPAL